MESCLKGDLDTAKKLYFKCENININANDDIIFINVCYQGHLNIAKWLLLVNITTLTRTPSI